MLGKKKQKESLNFKSGNYKMKDSYKADDLVVANLEYVSSELTLYGPMVKTTAQKYIFEMINEDEKIRYREIFTGFIADSDGNQFFDLPYVVNVVTLKEQVPSVADDIPKYGLLLVLNEVNTEKLPKQLKK